MSDEIKDFKPCNFILDCRKALEACSYRINGTPCCYRKKLEAPRPEESSGSAEFDLLTDKDGQKAHDIIWGALVDAEAPLTDGLKWAMDFFKPQDS